MKDIKSSGAATSFVKVEVSESSCSGEERGSDGQGRLSNGSGVLLGLRLVCLWWPGGELEELEVLEVLDWEDRVVLVVAGSIAQPCLD